MNNLFNTINLVERKEPEAHIREKITQGRITCLYRDTIYHTDTQIIVNTR